MTTIGSPGVTGAGGGGARVAVIGGGVSGALTAIHLLWRCRPEDRVYLVERGDRLGPGVAYSTTDPLHLLNVRADNMSAFVDEPDHFARWLGRLPEAERAEAGRKTLAGLFVRREVYGRYVQELLRDAIDRQGGAQNLYIVNDSATALRRRPDGGLLLETALGRAHEVDAAVLAVGNFPPARARMPRYVDDPWAPGALDGVEAGGRPVLLLGTGLTAVDVTLALLDRGLRAPVYALSRRGLLPQAHAPSTPWAGLRLDAEDRRSVATLCRGVRREVRRAAAAGVDWRCVVDALRPHVQLLWQELAPPARQRFLRHLRPWWEVHRHRTAPPVAEAVAAACAAGTLRVVAGQVGSIEPEADGLRVAWRPRGGGVGGDGETRLGVQRVVDCRGPGADYARLPDPLIRQLLADGLARPDPCRLGLEATQQGSLVGAEGRPTPCLFGVGPVTRGTFWEITSVPDIRAQAEQVATNALASVRWRRGKRAA